MISSKIISRTPISQKMSRFTNSSYVKDLQRSVLTRLCRFRAAEASRPFHYFQTRVNKFGNYLGEPSAKLLK